MQAVLFAVLTVVLWWGFAWLLDSLPWIESELALTTLALLPAVSLATLLLLVLSRSARSSNIGLPLDRLGLQHFGFGAAAGAGLTLSIVTIQWLCGWVELEYGSVAGSLSEVLWAPSLGAGLVVLACGAIGEELMFRGYGLQQFMLASHPWAAVLATSALFGALHRDNPDFSGVALVNTILFGTLFGLALLRHRSLWLPCGIHFGWNFSLACVGANVSGLTIRLTGMEVVPVGPAFWSGAEYGPEASFLTTLVVGFAAALIWYTPLRSQREAVLWEQTSSRGNGPGEEVS
jgi:membrane protease YdiL (CAAX protease family)